VLFLIRAQFVLELRFIEILHYFLLFVVSLVVCTSAFGCRDESSVKWTIMCRLTS